MACSESGHESSPSVRQAEFLFECVEETVNKILPEEVAYLTKYDLLNDFIKNYIDMPDKLVNLLIRFLGQNNGKLSESARGKKSINLQRLKYKPFSVNMKIFSKAAGNKHRKKQKNYEQDVA